MKKLSIQIWLCLILPLFFIQIFAQSNYNKDFLNFQVGKEKLILDKSSFSSVKLQKNENDIYSVLLELKEKPAIQFSQFTARHINSSMTIIWNGHIINSSTIRTPLGAKMQITGFSKEIAKEFVQVMQK